MQVFLLMHSCCAEAYFDHVCVLFCGLIMMYLAPLTKLKQLSQFRLFAEFVISKSSATGKNEHMWIGDELNYVLTNFCHMFEFLILMC